MRLILKTHLASLILTFLFNKSNSISGLRCFTCTQCSDSIDDLQSISNEPCNGRCYIRKDLTNEVSRGCDVRFWYSKNEQIPNNGCRIRNDGETWCWCDTADYCNRLSIESNIYKTSTIITTLVSTSTVPSESIIIYEGCLVNPCENSGTCFSNHFEMNFFICICLPFYTGKTCTIPISDNSKSLEMFLQSFMKQNFHVYEQFEESDELEDDEQVVEEEEEEQEEIP